MAPLHAKWKQEIPMAEVSANLPGIHTREFLFHLFRFEASVCTSRMFYFNRMRISVYLQAKELEFRAMPLRGKARKTKRC